MITPVIFDMDGLMIDSERVTFEGYKHVLAKHNLTLSLEAYKTLLGKPVKAVYELFHKDYGDDFDVEETIKAVHQLSLIHISEPTRQAEISYAVFCLKKKKRD